MGSSASKNQREQARAAFARAFKRITGTPPAAWRRERQASGA
jgi:AraC-like DNA-binding protein